MNGMTNGREKPTTIGGVGGAITLGNGLTMTGNELSASGSGSEQHLYWHSVYANAYKSSINYLNAYLTILTTSSSSVTADTIKNMLNSNHDMKFVVPSGNVKVDGTLFPVIALVYNTDTSFMIQYWDTDAGRIKLTDSYDYSTFSGSGSINDAVDQIF